MGPRVQIAFVAVFFGALAVFAFLIGYRNIAEYLVLGAVSGPLGALIGMEFRGRRSSRERDDARPR